MKMKICVTAQAESLDAQIEARFGRCSFFVIVNSETMTYEVVSNTAVNAMGGAGVQAAQTLVDKDVSVVLTGNIGPNAYRVLSAAGIRMVTGVTGNVENAVKQYQKGTLSETTGPTVSGHFGVSRQYRRR
jgi:predicted Fe-Mo cluster-binding NifX family protein